jgi:peptidoglycan/xylan/chitin deacetylase (PgdA/CDA1 family)
MIAKTLFYALTYLFGRGVPDAGMSILCYHSVDDSGSRISLPPELFRAHMRLLRDLGYRGITLAEIVERLRRGTPFEPKRVAITFDDGFANLATHAAPIMREYGFTGTAFIVSGMVGKVTHWRNREGSLPQLPLLSWRQVRELRDNGFELGAHSVSHRYLTPLADVELHHEIHDSRRAIEDATSAPVEIFSYPYGDYDERVAGAVARAGYKGACATIPTRLRGGDSPFALPRIFIARDTTPLMLRALLTPGATASFRLLSLLRSRRGVPRPWYIPDPRHTDSTGTLPGPVVALEPLGGSKILDA